MLNNLRQLSSAANQYFLENGLTAVASADLVGTASSQYIKQINPVIGESYDTVIVEGAGISAYGGTGTQSYAITYSN